MGRCALASCLLLLDAVSQCWVPGLQWPVRFLSQASQSLCERYLISDTKAQAASLSVLSTQLSSHSLGLLGKAWPCTHAVPPPLSRLA